MEVMSDTMRCKRIERTGMKIVSSQRLLRSGYLTRNKHIQYQIVLKWLDPNAAHHSVQSHDVLSLHVIFHDNNNINLALSPFYNSNLWLLKDLFFVTYKLVIIVIE